MDQRKIARERSLFCFAGRLICADLWSRLSTMHRETRREWGNRIHTKYICIHCYADKKLASNKDVEAREERQGRPFHPICKDCLRNGVPVVYKTGGKKHQGQAMEEKRKRKSAGRVAHKRRRKMKHAQFF